MMLVSEYHPKAYQIPSDGEDIDIDASNDGDYIVCPIHENVIIYVMGTGFWTKEGGTCSYGWTSITVLTWCHLCQKHRKVNLGSYGG